jgi:hypothetical protein
MMYWDDSYRIPRTAMPQILIQIHTFFELTLIPLHEVAKVWKISFEDLVRFVERGFLVTTAEHEEDEEQGESQELVMERSTGLSVYNSSRERMALSGEKVSEGQPIGPFGLSLFDMEMSSSSLIRSPLPSCKKAHLPSQRPSSRVSSLSKGTTPVRSPVRGGSGLLTDPGLGLSLSQSLCITRLDLYIQPSLIQRSHLTNLTEVCGAFGFQDLSEVIVFLTDRTGTDHLATIEWGMEIFMITTELNELLYKWKLLSLSDLPSLIGWETGPRTQLDLNEMKEVILTSRRHHGDSATTALPASPLGGEYFPLIDWEGKTFILQSDLHDLAKLLNEERKRRRR